MYHRNSLYKAKFRNEVGDVIGIIFVNTKTKDLPFKDNEDNPDRSHGARRYITADSFKNFYKVPEKNLKVIIDPTK